MITFTLQSCQNPCETYSGPKYGLSNPPDKRVRRWHDYMGCSVYKRDSGTTRDARSHWGHHTIHYEKDGEKLSIFMLP